MVSFTISISSEGFSASLHPTPAGSIYSGAPSINYSPPPPPPCQRQRPHRNGILGHYAHNSSTEYLLPARTRFASAQLNSKLRGITATKRYSSAAAASMEATSIPIERRRSYGRGGAGNIRHPSAVPFASNPGSSSSGDNPRRRSSVWSAISISPSSSPDGKRATLLSLFGRKNSVAADKEDPQPQPQPQQAASQGEPVKFKEVNMGGK